MRGQRRELIQEIIPGPEYSAAIQKTESFRLLQLDWNGYNAEPIREQSITDAIDFIRMLYKVAEVVDIYNVSVFPAATGCVQVEFDMYFNEKKVEFEAYFTEDAIEFLIDLEGEMQEFKLPTELILRRKK
jgi:hypothetical protein